MGLNIIYIILVVFNYFSRDRHSVLCVYRDLEYEHSFTKHLDQKRTTASAVPVYFLVLVSNGSTIAEVSQYPCRHRIRSGYPFYPPDWYQQISSPLLVGTFRTVLPAVRVPYRHFAAGVVLPVTKKRTNGKRRRRLEDASENRTAVFDTFAIRPVGFDDERAFLDHLLNLLCSLRMWYTSYTGARRRVARDEPDGLYTSGEWGGGAVVLWRRRRRRFSKKPDRVVVLVPLLPTEISPCIILLRPPPFTNGSAVRSDRDRTEETLFVTCGRHRSCFRERGHAGDDARPRRRSRRSRIRRARRRRPS